MDVTGACKPFASRAMKTSLVFLLILLLAACRGKTPRADSENSEQFDKAAAPPDKPEVIVKEAGKFGVRTRVVLTKRDRFPSHDAPVCMLAGELPGEYKYQELGRIRGTRGGYGSIDSILSAMADEGRRLGMDAIIGLQADQRVRLVLPWRAVYPIGDGRLVKLQSDSPPIKCTEIGGKAF